MAASFNKESSAANKKNTKTPSKNKKVKSRGEKKSVIKVSEAVAEFEDPLITFKDDIQGLKAHYLSILNDQSFKTKKNENLKIKALFGLMNLIPRFNEEQIIAQIIYDLEFYGAPLINKVAHNLRVMVFGEDYIRYKEIIKNHKKTAQVTEKKSQNEMTAAEKPRSAAAASLDFKSSSSKLKFFNSSSSSSAQNKASQPASVVQKNTTHVSEIREIPEELMHFKDILSDKELPQIELSYNELRLLIFLYMQDLVPLIQGGAVVDSMRQKPVPYRDIDCICFSSVSELEGLLNKYKKELHIEDFELMFDTFFRIKFKKENESYENEVFDLSYLVVVGDKLERKKQMASLLKKSAKNYVINKIVFYDIFNRWVLDPLKQRRRIELNILDVAEIFDKKLDIDQEFKTRPAMMLSLVATQGKNEKFGNPLHASFLNQHIIKNKNCVGRRSSHNKFPQSLFDKLFIHGSILENYRLLRQFDMMHDLFPMFEKNKKDIDIMDRACLMVAERYSNLEKLHTYDPTKRVPMLTIQQEQYLRITFFDDLLSAKFLEHHPLQRYLEHPSKYSELLVKNDINVYLNLCSFKINPLVREQLKTIWWKKVIVMMHEVQDHHQSNTPRPS